MGRPENKELYNKELGSQEGNRAQIIVYSMSPKFTVFVEGSEYYGNETVLDELISSLQEAREALKNG